VAIIQNVILSVILAFAGKPLYAPYAALAHRPGGLSALADQQLGASIMWSVGDLPFVIALVGLVMSVLYAQMDTDAREGTGSATVAAGPGR
jgi:cytochrome c oxidase assembly factor CtaG